MRISSPLLALPLCLALSLASCGGAADPTSQNDAGYQALNSGKHTEAADEFDAALTGIGSNTGDSQYLRAMWGLIEANTHIDPDRAKDDFLALAKANSATMSAKDYSKVGSWLTDADAYTQALEVVDAGSKAYPETPALAAMIDQIKKKAEQSGDEELSSALDSLGYLGD